jgi:hypothetical protein
MLSAKGGISLEPLDQFALCVFVRIALAAILEKSALPRG